MGEWSPECHRIKGLSGPSSTTVGARFRGYNKYDWLRWSVPCEVKTVEPERELMFSTMRRGKEMTRWRFRLEPSDGGTDLEESFEAVHWALDVRLFEDYFMRNRNQRREQGMRTTLERIKAAAERARS